MTWELLVTAKSKAAQIKALARRHTRAAIKVLAAIIMAQHERFRRFSGRYGQVVGRFRTSDCEGHLCLFGGSLDQVTISPR
jgi:hypothetical protein